MNTADSDALWWARARAEGPLPVRTTVQTPAGMRRLLEPGGQRCWLLPEPPDGVTPALLREFQLAGFPVEFRNESNRVLAAALRCCWTDENEPLWPGQPAPMDDVLDVFGQLQPGRGPDALYRMGLSALRRLRTSSWLLVDEEARRVFLGPRVATWPEQDLTALRELYQELPGPRPRTRSAE